MNSILKNRKMRVENQTKTRDWVYGQKPWQKNAVQEFHLWTLLLAYALWHKFMARKLDKKCCSRIPSLDITFSLCSLVFRYGSHAQQQQPGRPARPGQLQPRLQHAAATAAAPAAAAARLSRRCCATAGSAHHVPAAAGQQSFPGDVDGSSAAAAAGAQDDRLATTECVPGALYLSTSVWGSGSVIMLLRIRFRILSFYQRIEVISGKILCFIIFSYPNGLISVW